MKEETKTDAINQLLGLEAEAAGQDMAALLQANLRDKHEGTLSPERRKQGWEEILRKREESAESRVLPFPKKNNFKKYLTPVAAVAAMFMVAIYFYGNSTNSAADAVAGRIEGIQGNISVNGKPYELNTPVAYGDRIQGAEGSSYDLIFAGKNLVHISDKSELVYRIAKSNSILELKRGALAAIIRNKQGIGGLTVNTPQARAQVTGTIFYLKTEGEDNTYFCLCHGKLHLSAQGGSAQTVEASHHVAYRFSRVGDTIKREKAGMDYHMDPFLEKLARKIDEKVTW